MFSCECSTRYLPIQSAHLSPESTHTFKVEAGDPAQNWSIDGPLTTATLPQIGNPRSTTQLASTMSWLMEHRYLGILTGGYLGIAAAGVLLIQKRRR